MPAQVGKMDVGKRRTYNGQKQRAVKCSALEPVLEHCELAPTGSSAPKHESACDESKSRKRGKPMRILVKLRDGYVKLMNDISSGADLAGVATFYGCPAADFPVGAMANYSRLPEREEQEKDTMVEALHVQLTHSRQLAVAIA